MISRFTNKSIIIPAKTIIELEGIVILPLKEYEKLRKRATETERVDKLIEGKIKKKLKKKI